MIKLIGTTHLTPKEEIYQEIENFNPDIIGVELCEVRVGLKPMNLDEQSLIMQIASMVKKKAEEENVVYGSDMSSAIQYANEKQIKVSLIDRDLIETSNLMNKIPKEELIGFMNELKEFETKILKQEIENLNIEKTLNELKTKYPISYEFLVVSRDLFMANKILKLEKNNPDKKIIIFIGKGHLKQIEELIK